MMATQVQTLTQETLSSRRTRLILIVVTVVGLLHHIDHVLRVDHSGYPFIADVTPFTASLIVYPVAAFIFFSLGRFWLKFWLLSAMYFSVQAAHIFVESPVDQYVTWATNASQVSDPVGMPNLLGVASPVLGVVAVVVSLALSVVLIAAMVSAYMDAKRAA